MDLSDYLDLSKNKKKKKHISKKINTEIKKSLEKYLQHKKKLRKNHKKSSGKKTSRTPKKTVRVKKYPPVVIKTSAMTAINKLKNVEIKHRHEYQT